MYLYEVGKLYNPERTRWQECAQYNYRGGQHELIIFYSRPSRQEVQAINKSESEFGLVVEGDVIFFLYRFGSILPWSDAPFSWWLVPEDERVMPPPETSTELRALLQVILVDADSGIIKAMRALTLSNEFTVKLHHAIYEQSQRNWPGDGAYEKQLQVAYQKYPDSATMARAAIKSKGGA